MEFWEAAGGRWRGQDERQGGGTASEGRDGGAQAARAGTARKRPGGAGCAEGKRMESA